MNKNAFLKRFQNETNLNAETKDCNAIEFSCYSEHLNGQKCGNSNRLNRILQACDGEKGKTSMPAQASTLPAFRLLEKLVGGNDIFSNAIKATSD